MDRKDFETRANVFALSCHIMRIVFNSGKALSSEDILQILQQEKLMILQGKGDDERRFNKLFFQYRSSIDFSLSYLKNLGYLVEEDSKYSIGPNGILVSYNIPDEKPLFEPLIKI